MRMALAIIVAGLTFSCIPIALAMEACAPRSSLTFQIMMFIAGVSAALGVVITLAVWTADNARDLRRVSGKYRDLIAQVPLSVPAMPPGAELVPAVSTLSRFADLAVSATPGSAGPVATPSTPRGRPQAPTTPPSPSQPQLVPPQAVARLSAVQQNLTFRPRIVPGRPAPQSADSTDAEMDAILAQPASAAVSPLSGVRADENVVPLPINRTYRSTA